MLPRDLHPASAAVIDQHHALKEGAADQRSVGLLAFGEGDPVKEAVLEPSQDGSHDMSQVHIELMLAADTTYGLAIDKGQFQSLRERIIDTAYCGAGIDKGRHLRDLRSGACAIFVVPVLRVEADIDP